MYKHASRITVGATRYRVRLRPWAVFIMLAAGLIGAESTIANGDSKDSPISKAALAAGQVPTSIRYVSTGGFWEHGGNYGTHRVLVVSQGDEHTQPYTFVQWVQLSGPERRGEVVETVGVSELNRTAALIVSAVEISGNDPAEARARLKLVDRATNEPHEGTLQLGTPGVYRFDVK